MTKKWVDILLYVIAFLLSSKATMSYLLGPLDLQPKVLMKKIHIKTRINQKNRLFLFQRKAFDKHMKVYHYI